MRASKRFSVQLKKWCEQNQILYFILIKLFDEQCNVKLENKKRRDFSSREYSLSSPVEWTHCVVCTTQRMGAQPMRWTGNVFCSFVHFNRNWFDPFIIVIIKIISKFFIPLVSLSLWFASFIYFLHVCPVAAAMRHCCRDKSSSTSSWLL